MKIALKIAYDGRFFHGYARQPKLKTVEGELIKILTKHNLIAKDVKESKFRSASRTDKGVSAFCNIISFNANKLNNNILELLSNELVNIVVYAMAKVEPDFNPRYAKHRQYRYYLNSKDIDIEKIISATSIFTGKHNFSNFARVEKHKNPVRTIDNIVFSELDDFLIIDFFAQTYLWQQVRRIISALEKLGKNKLEKEQIIEALKNPNKKVDFGVAPAEPLILKDIVYDFNFRLNQNLLNQAKKFEQKIISFLQ